MRDRIAYLRHSLNILLRNDAWLIVTPFVLLLIVGIWTLYVAVPSDWRPFISVAQAEALGSLISIFLCAGLLDPEMRHGANEIVFSKPHRAVVLLATRLALAMLILSLAMAALLWVYQFRLGDAAIGPSIMLGLPSWLFAGLIALTIAQFTRTPLGGIGVSLLFWVWSSIFAMLYNPMLLLTGGFAVSTGAERFGIDLNTNKIALLIASALLFWLCVRRVVRSGGERSAGEAAPRGILGRFARPVAIAGILVAYFLTGFVAKLGMLSRTAGIGAGGSPGMFGGRPTPDGATVGLNQSYQQSMAVYGPVPISKFVGLGTGDFFHGLGIGVDSQSSTAGSEKRRALSQPAARPGPWRNRSLLELAGLDLMPAPFDWRPDSHLPENEPAWVTVGLADPERWWITRTYAGPDPEAADRRCSQVIETSTDPEEIAAALQMRSQIANSRWQFGRASGLRKELVLVPRPLNSVGNFWAFGLR